MYPSIFNSFPVIRTASAKNRRFYVPQPTFSPLETPLRLSRNICCMYGKTIQCLPNPSQHVPSYIQQFPSYTKSMRKSKNRYFYHIIRSQCVNRRFHVPQPTFLFPLETPLRMRLSRNLLHGWKENSMLAKPLTAFTYLYLIVSELYDA